jgi:hypothetical protein
MVAEHGHFDAGFADNFEQVTLAFYFDGNTVDFHHIRNLHDQNSSLTAPKEQLLLQAPHLMHFSWSITKGDFSTPSIAWTGQLRAHLEQPLHFSGSMTKRFSLLQVPDGQRFS